MPQTTMPVFFLFFFLLPGLGWAEYPGGSGEPNDPYQIAAAADLLALAADTNNYDKNFVLTADINLAAYTFTTAVIASDGDNPNWMFDGAAFAGVFDGTGHKILNLTIDTNGAANEYLGLFGFVTGEIKNLSTENVEIISGDVSCYLGGMMGQNNGNVTNCSSITAVIGESYSLYYVGGLAGQNNGNIINCFSTATIISGSDSLFLGGLTGWNCFGTISNCYSTGAVNSTGNYLGGLAGQNDAAISNCYSTVNVTGESSSSCLGGLVGWNYYGPISNCYSTGLVSGPVFSLGGLVGENNGSENINNCYFLITSGTNNGYGTPLTDPNMKLQCSFLDWDFVSESANGTEDFWAICETITYPKLTWQFTVGDSDNDKDIDFADFAAMALKWLLPDSNLYCGGTDLTGDGWVDINDLEILTGNWLN
ncbi:MAG: GLUG motif-containing protein [Phycisphaerae bacterium]|nr:GLUG motif-containing protein [Phycisphaerae bacterium]